MKYSLTIIGGYGAMGIWALNFFHDNYLLDTLFDVTITGPNETKGKKIASKFNVKFELDNIKASKTADITIISVPIELTEKTIQEIGPHLKSNSLLLDLASVKSPIVAAMKKYVKKDVHCISLHPMFGPRVLGLEGRVILIVDVSGSKWKNDILDFLNKYKSHVIETDAKKHDKTLAIVQCLTHFAYISIGATLKEMNLDIKESRNFASPIYELMLDLIGRIIGQNPKLYADIQMYNPYAAKTHEVFLDKANELKEAVKNKDHHKFEKIMSDAGKHFDDVESALERSDKAIEVLNKELRHLKEALGKEIAFKHMYSGKIHYGILKDIKKDYLTLLSNKKSMNVNISNISLLDENELLDIKKEVKKTVDRDFSYVFDENLDEKILKELIYNSSRTILQTEVIDVFRGKKIPANKKSVTIRVNFLNEDIKTQEQNVKNILVGLCGKIRQ